MADTMWGADAEQLEQLGSQIDGAADTLRTTAQTLNQAILSSSWDGGDAETFRSDWSSTHRLQIESAAQHLTEASEVLRRNAGGQRQASDSAGGGAGPGGSGAPGESPGDGDGVPFGDEVRGEDSQEIDGDLAHLSGDVYNYEADGSGEGLPEGWNRLDEEELWDELHLKPGDLVDPDTGFQAGIYRNDEGEYVLAFAGTDPTSIEDWVTNLAQGGDLLPGIELSAVQYSQAAALASHVQAQVGDELVITGHSLGGGLAAYAALGTGSPAITYNAAGLSDASFEALHYDPAVGTDVASEGLIRNYHTESDILTNAQNSTSLAPNAVGTQYPVSDQGPRPDLGVSVSTPDSILGFDVPSIEVGVDAPEFVNDVVYAGEQHLIENVIGGIEQDEPWKN